MIYRLTEKWAIEPIVKLIEIRDDIFKIPKKKLGKYLLNALTDKNSVIFIDEKDKILRGFVFASVEEFNGEDVCFIHSCIIDPKQKNTGFEFMARLKKWCENKGLKKMVIGTDRPEAFIKKYKFKYETTLLSKDLNRREDG